MTDPLAALKMLATTKLRERWHVAFGTPPPVRLNRHALLLALGWQAQAKTYGGCSRATREQLSHLAKQLRTDRDLGNPTLASRPIPTAGSSLVREWRSTVHQVQVLEKGYRWNDKVWPSLSAIAFEITGTKWNGPAFFGLRSKKLQKPDSRK